MKSRKLILIKGSFYEALDRKEFRIYFKIINYKNEGNLNLLPNC